MNKIYQGDTLQILKTWPDQFVDCVITLPPYWGLRDYGVEGQLGLEKTPEEYIEKMVEIFREVRRVLKKEGTAWINLGDSYAAGGNGGGTEKQDSNRGTLALKGKVKKAPPGLKPKDLVGIPWMVAFALRADGWYLRQDIIWAKPNPMPESVIDRCTKSHEYIFLMAKSQKYYFDQNALKETAITAQRPSRRAGWATGKDHSAIGGTPFAFMESGLRNRRSVWTLTTTPFPEAHFATFPEALITPMILAGCPRGGIVLDPFMGSGTTGAVAKKLGRNYLGIELNPAYIVMAEKRLSKIPEPLFT